MLSLWTACFCFIQIFAIVCADDYFTQLEKMLLEEHGRQGSEALHGEFATDRPKEIEIVCPEGTQVFIRDLIDNGDNTEECM